MSTSCPPQHGCNTYAPGWLHRGHPKVEDGVVFGKVCFHWGFSCCFLSKMIKLRNCGTYYVYYLQSTPACNLRYCGDGYGLGKFNLPSSFLSFRFFWFSVSDTKQEDLKLTQIYIYIYIYIIMVFLLNNVSYGL